MLVESKNQNEQFNQVFETFWKLVSPYQIVQAQYSKSELKTLLKFSFESGMMTMQQLLVAPPKTENDPVDEGRQK